MANLETLELTISANAESATQGIGKLVRSLSALSTAIGKSVGGLKLLNKELSTLKGFGSMRMPSLSKATGATKVVSAAQRQAQAIEEWKQNRKPLTISHFRDNVWTEEQERAANPQWFNNYESPEWQEKINANKAFQETTESAYKLSNSMKEVGEATEIPVTKIDALKMKLEGLDQAMDKASAKGDMLSVANKRLAQIATADKIEKESNAMNSGAKEAGFFATAFEKAKGAVSNFGKTFSRVGRIFSTMLIRTAIRSLMKAFTEAWGAAYQFSKGMGGQFAESVDKAKTLLAGTATNIISAFSPAFMALIPVLNAVAGIINYLCNAIRSLFALLGMGSDLWGASTDAINKYSKAAGGAGGKNKEMLASFDELNVISQESGGGSGGGGASYINGMFSDVITDEMAKIQLIVSESLLALGLILACTGHIGIGAALMAIGAAGIAKTVFEDWNKLPSEMQGTLATIMSIIGVSTLALGAILAFSGANIPLGIGLMVIGAANLAAVAYVNWKNGLPENVRSTITTIMEIAGKALLAIGAVLALSGANVPLGIGMMIAGGLSLASAVGLNWNSIKDKVSRTFDTIKEVVELAWDTIVKYAEDAWNAVSKWWEESGVGPFIRKAWGGVSTFFKGLWEDVSLLAGAAWQSVGKWWKENVTSKVEKEGIWGGVKGFFEGIWNSITTNASLAWDGVKIWWESTGISNWMSRVWGDVGNFLKNSVWDPIKNAVSKAWDKVKQWWEDTGIGSGIRRVWNAVLVFLRDTVWGGIVSKVTSAWETIKKWWQDNIYTNMKTLWDKVKSIFQPVLDVVKSIRDTINEITGKHTIEIIQKFTTQGTPENSVAKSLTNFVTAPSKDDNIFTSLAKTVSNGVLGLIGLKAEGAYDIPRGDLFIANEAGAELVGSIGGKTSVANQGQIIEGISSGVERANAEQNALLRQQNDLLRGILEKEYSVRLGASPAFGRTVQQSLDMYNTVGG